MEYMLYYASSLASLDLYNNNTSNVNNMIDSLTSLNLFKSI